MFVFALAVVFKICSIQYFNVDKYRSLAQKRTLKNVEIPANRGNMF
jgi:cell division protein FtsI (penicillin-binding protein 3)